MQPTCELRFVEREDRRVYTRPTGTNSHSGWRTVRVLQQKWVEMADVHGRELIVEQEWRDVPVVSEG